MNKFIKIIFFLLLNYSLLFLHPVKSEEKSIVEIQQEKNLSMREMLAKIWGIDEGKSPFATEEAPKKKSGKTESGQKATNVSVNPELAPVVQTQIVPNADR